MLAVLVIFEKISTSNTVMIVHMVTFYITFKEFLCCFMHHIWLVYIGFYPSIFDIASIADWLEMPGSLILLLVVAPGFFAYTIKDSWVGVAICLIIGCYLLQEHIRASGGFRNSFTERHGISNTLGIILLLVYPVWSLVLHIV